MVFNKSKDLLISKPKIYINLKSNMISNLVGVDLSSVILQIEYNWATERKRKRNLIKKIDRLIDESWNNDLKKVISKFKRLHRWNRDEIDYFTSRIINLQNNELNLFLNNRRPDQLLARKKK
ncbi:hypothetical protein GCW_02505 [Mycoplasmoides gallisepticum S6]|uniref:Uncharacterized protein n=2 Tax=Mycoplasmoides gallisepticum TaxID=2096 RepID=A0A0F6CKT4_MYCGL|nr:hypothetical protein [Mycoplasmoides gallisepticum]AHB99706.1 hypothetical protein GCW_02505 [Mycoplasmoides gallisepticum S6]